MANENKEGNKTPRRTFSVSKEFESILPDIDAIPNMSRFICEAIYEKLERTKNPNKDLQNALAHFVQIQSIIGTPMTQTGISTEQQWVAPSQVQTASSLSVEQPTPQTVPVERQEESDSFEELEDKKEELEKNTDEPEIEMEEKEEVLHNQVITTEEPPLSTNQEDAEIEEEKEDDEDDALTEARKNFLKKRTSY